MKRSFLFFLFVFCFLVFPLAAQPAEYTITEAELTRLEATLKGLEQNRENLQLQVQSLKARLTGALKTSERLSEQLKTEREALKNLGQSFNEYEKEAAAEIKQKQAQIDKLKEEKHRYAVTALCAVIGSLFFLIIGYFIFKLKIL